MQTLLALALAAATPDMALSRLWQSISSEAGQAPDTAAMRRLFHSEAMVYGSSYQKGGPVLSAMRAADFIKSQETVRKQGFHECEIVREIKVFDRFATAYSVVESRIDKSAAKPAFTGVNSIQLARVGDQWQIVSLHYHVGKPDMAVPLSGAASGACLP